MRVAINLLQYDEKGTGGTTYAFGLLRGLLEYADGHQFLLISSPGSVESWKALVGDRMEIAVVPFPGRRPRTLSELARRSLFELGFSSGGQVKKAVQKFRPDVVHYTGDRLMPKGLNYPAVVTFFGANYWVLPSVDFWRAKWITRLSKLDIQRSIHKADCVLAPSTFVRHVLVQLAGLPSEKIQICSIVNWVERIATGLTSQRVEEVKRKHGLERPYFFYPAADFPYKNHRRLFEALKIAGESYGVSADLALTGHQSRELAQAAWQAGVGDRVLFLGYVPREHLASLYAGAIALVHPSLYEATGSLSLMEAMYCGCPVLCSRLDSLLELMQGAALYFDPYDPQQIAQRLHQAATSEAGLRLAEAAKERLAEFSMQQSVSDILAAYRLAQKRFRPSQVS